MKTQNRTLEQVLGPTVIVGIVVWVAVFALIKFF